MIFVAEEAMGEMAGSYGPCSAVSSALTTQRLVQFKEVSAMPIILGERDGATNRKTCAAMLLGRTPLVAAPSRIVEL